MNSDHGWQCLAEAIVRQACADYDAALRMRARHPDQPRWHAICASQVRFFRSEWFSLLTPIDGTALERSVRLYAETPGSVPLSARSDPLPWG